MRITATSSPSRHVSPSAPSRPGGGLALPPPDVPGELVTRATVRFGERFPRTLSVLLSLALHVAVATAILAFAGTEPKRTTFPVAIMELGLAGLGGGNGFAGGGEAGGEATAVGGGNGVPTGDALPTGQTALPPPPGWPLPAPPQEPAAPTTDPLVTAEASPPVQEMPERTITDQTSTTPIPPPPPRNELPPQRALQPQPEVAPKAAPVRPHRPPPSPRRQGPDRRNAAPPGVPHADDHQGDGRTGSGPGAGTGQGQGSGSGQGGRGDHGAGVGQGSGEGGGSGGPGGNGHGAGGMSVGEFGVGEGPRFLTLVQPRYPKKANLKEKNGVVTLRLTIDAQGKLLQASVVASGGLAFDDAALESVRASTYIPAMRHGQPVACQALLRIRFNLVKQ